MATPVYGSNVGVVEPYALDRIDDRERHGHPRDLFALWFGANAETANFAVGILAVALYGASLRGAVLGLVAGSIAGYAIVGIASCAGPKYGLPQMVFSRRVFGSDGNALPAMFAFLAGVGWFSIDTIFGAQAVAALLHVPYLLALAGLLVAQITIAVYGYNAIHAFERVAGIASIAGFGAIALVVLARANAGAGFDAHAPLASGGPIGAIAFSASLAFAYSIGWAPSAADYSRYLPAASSPRAITAWAFSGGFLPSTALMVLGAAAATVVRAPGIADATPAQTMTLVAGDNPTIAAIGLTTVLIGTLSGNVMNLYSGALSALVAIDPRGRYSLIRWQAAVVVGLLGGALAIAGADPIATAHLYGNFLSLLSTWAAPWAGVVIGARSTGGKRWHVPALVAWLAGIAAGVPFWQQSWYVGPIAAAHPQIGDASYIISFVVALIAMRALRG